MSYSDLEENKGLRITHLIIQCIAAGILFVMAYGLLLTTDFVRTQADTFAMYMYYWPGMSYINNLLIGGIILQFCGVFLLIVAGIQRIIAAIMKSGKP